MNSADFEFGNLIYILLTLVFIIFGAKKKKKPVKTASAVLEEEGGDTETDIPVTNPGDSFRKVFGDMLNIDQQFFEEPKIQEPVLDSQVSDLDTIEEEEGTKEIYRMADHLGEISHVEDKDLKAVSEIRPSLAQMLTKEFDPKKALLYSEIFKPKYF